MKTTMGPFWSVLCAVLMLLAPEVRAKDMTIEQMEDMLGVSDSELMPEVIGKQRFQKWQPHEDQKWDVEAQTLDPDTRHFKAKPRSQIVWEETDPIEWLDVNRWITERDLKDKTPDWRLRLRQSSLQERMGKLVSCIGNCRIYRGSEYALGRHMSRIQEGDEVHTDDKSYAWIWLVDGTLVRLAPKTAVSFLEMNFAPERTFWHVRLAQGMVYWHPRTGKQLISNTLAETDPLFLPIIEKTANVEYFERKQYRPLADEGRGPWETNGQQRARKDQYEEINRLVDLNNKSIGERRNQLLLVAPNGSIEAEDATVSMFYATAGKSHLKWHDLSAQESGEMLAGRKPAAKFHYRGYTNTNQLELAADKWYEVSETGREISEQNEASGLLTLSELLVKRIPTFTLVREQWLAKDAVSLNESLKNPEWMAARFGYHLWGDELSKRQEFLREHSRRMETTNLSSLNKLMESLAQAGEFKPYGFSEDYFVLALNHYLKDFKTKYAFSRQSVKDMGDLQYYAWILIHARQR